ncbi:MAG: hypothetical protein ABI999_15950 [Acidobacteriota bacterium]
MDIRRALPADRYLLLDVGLRSVSATHTFVSEKDIRFFLPEVLDYLASAETAFGLSRNSIESLFLAPYCFAAGSAALRSSMRTAHGGPLTVYVIE